MSYASLRLNKGSCRVPDRSWRTLAWLARLQGYDWQNWFNGSFPTDLVGWETWDHPTRTKPQLLGPSNFSLYSHGVNNAVALKWAAAWSHVYGPPELAEASLFAWQRLSQHHGLPSGSFGADEHLAGSDAFRGTELCVVVESMRSLEESYAALPDRPELIDALERLAFNALPAAVSEDHWTHQYLTQSNAIYTGIESVNADDTQPIMSEVFGNVGLDATVYGLSPNFPCCTVNFGQGWGKFVALGLWLFDGGGEMEMPLLLSAAFAPSMVRLPWPLEGEVELDTVYPFNPEAPLRYIVRKAKVPFQLLVRVPQWADLQRSQVHGSHGPLPIPSGERPSVFVLPVHGDTVWEVRFAAEWKLVERHGSGYFSFGPLTFVKRLQHRSIKLPPDDGPYGPGAHPPAAVRDEMLLPTEDWAFGFLLNHTWQRGITESTKFLPGEVVSFEACPIRTSVPGASLSQSHMSLAPRPKDLNITGTLELSISVSVGQEYPNLWWDPKKYLAMDAAPTMAYWFVAGKKFVGLRT
ncbi:unnamed protein product [Cladocopium goreaui]|uniref:Uncharacterized protein n=1 Tax=Cladocopium goreaui TaxID=2562237 RepID=A0A9P1BYQ6_9DINO|nr:unnamed protein product [Cladocopium goreaui]